MFVILMFMSSAIFNTVSEKTLKAQIEENINAEVRGLSNLMPKYADLAICVQKMWKILLKKEEHTIMIYIGLTEALVKEYL